MPFPCNIEFALFTVIKKNGRMRTIKRLIRKALKYTGITMEE